MKLGWFEVLFLGFVAGVAGLWYFGRTQSLVIIQKSPMVTCPCCQGKGATKCPKCGDFGSLESFMQCPECKGTGKHSWRITSKLGAPCRQCRGTGSVEGRQPCSFCNSTGKVTCERCGGTGQLAAAGGVRIQTVRAEPSLWERALTLIGLGPGPNPKPVRDKSGQYPLLRKYIDLKTGVGTVVLEWGEAAMDGPEWKVATLLERADTTGRKTQRRIEFIVRDREVLGSRPVPGGGP